jgi:hypothetical protein
MTILFEGKEYATQEELRKDRFPTRSCHIIKRYVIQGGCKTMAEVAMAEAVAHQAGLKKALIAARARASQSRAPKSTVDK